MPRPPRAGLLALVAAAAAVGLASVGCGDEARDDPAPLPRGEGAPAPGPAAAGATMPLPRARDLVFPRVTIRVLLTGNERGTLKPCGCSSPQTGGLVRLAAFWEWIRGGAGASIAVSLGETIGGGDPPAQNALKLELHEAAREAMGYDGHVLAASELIQGPQPRVGDAQCPRPPLNVRLKERGVAAACFGVDPILRVEKGGLRVRVVSVVDPETREALEAMGVAEPGGVLPPEVALQALVREPGLLVVAAHAYREDLAKIVRAVEGKADVVVVVDVPSQTAYARPLALHVPEKPLLVRFDERGKEVGVLDLVREGDRWKAAWRAVVLDPSLEEGESPLRGAVDALFAVYRRRVREEGLLASIGGFPDEGLAYVGSARCAECHAAIHASWSKTPHAHALETLASKDYDWDPECIRCHVVGFERAANDQWTRWESGFRTPDATPALGGVGCENCHGPGSAHVADPTRKDVWKPYGAEGSRNWRDFGKRGCETCHDPDNSPGFSRRYDDHYRPRVDHREVPKDQRTVWSGSSSGN
jgi:hypothetical protein